LLHNPAACEHVRDAAGNSEIVLENHEVAMRISNQVSADHRNIDVARDFNIAHLPAVMFAGVNDAARHDSVFDYLALVVDVFEE
jgi:hypothetical protein